MITENLSKKELTAELQKLQEKLSKTERKLHRQRRHALSETNALLERIFDTTTVLIAYLDPEFNFIRVNRAYAEIDERLQDFYPGKNHFELFPNQENEAIFRKVVQTGAPYFAYEKAFEYHEHPERGVTYWDWSLLPVKGDRGQVEALLLTIINVTERKENREKLRRYQEELQKLASQLSTAQERERRRVAAYLHDFVAQSLAISKIKLGTLKQLLPDQGHREWVQEVCEHVDECIEYTRSLMFDLSPMLLYQVGLEAALRSLAETMSERHNLLIQFDGQGEETALPADTRGIIFQATRELLLNAVKHARATQLKVSLSIHRFDIRISVEDDGIGFETSEVGSHVHKDGGFGLFNIREQVRQLDGHLHITSERDRGTRAVITVPIGS